MADTNFQIVQRLFELSKNRLDYSPEPKGYKDAYLWLANYLNCAIKDLEREFNDKFAYAVSIYTMNLREQGHGWFYEPETLVYKRAQINQLIYAVYGERSVSEISFKKELGSDAYRDLIEQIDRTVLMSEEEKKAHDAQCAAFAREIIDEILAEEQAEKQA